MSLPVKIFPATQSSLPPLKHLDPHSLTPVKTQYYSPQTGQPISKPDVVTGYQVAPGAYAPVSQPHLTHIKSRPAPYIHPYYFVSTSEVPPTFYARFFYLVPLPGYAQLYHLLTTSLADTSTSALVEFYLRSRPRLGLLSPQDSHLLLHQLRYTNELLSPPQIPSPTPLPSSKQQRQFAELISTTTRPFKAELLTDPLSSQVIKELHDSLKPLASIPDLPK